MRHEVRDLGFRRNRNVGIDAPLGAGAADRYLARSRVVIPAEDNDGDLAVGANQPGRAQPHPGRPDDLDAGVRKLGREQRDLQEEVSDVSLSGNALLRGAADDKKGESLHDDTAGLTDSRADGLLAAATHFDQFKRDDHFVHDDHAPSKKDSKVDHEGYLEEADYGDDDIHYESDYGLDDCAHGQCGLKDSCAHGQCSLKDSCAHGQCGLKDDHYQDDYQEPYCPHGDGRCHKAAPAKVDLDHRGIVHGGDRRIRGGYGHGQRSYGGHAW